MFSPATDTSRDKAHLKMMTLERRLKTQARAFINGTPLSAVTLTRDLLMTCARSAGHNVTPTDRVDLAVSTM